MTQNTSSAVMQQRREPHDSLDDFPAPPWATRALCEWLFHGHKIPLAQVCREPAANRGHMVRPLSEWFRWIYASDLHDYGAGFPKVDYLFGKPPETVSWTITNPPFRMAEAFIERALETSSVGVAMLVRSAFLEGQGRFERLFNVTPPNDILQFAERVIMHKGKLVDPNRAVTVVNAKTGRVTKRKPSTATSYCWLIWRQEERASFHNAYETRLHWIAPCRARLERPEDYPA